MASTIAKSLFAMLIFSYTWLFQEQNQEWDRLRQLIKGANNLATHDAALLAVRDMANGGLALIDYNEAYAQYVETLKLNLGLDESLIPISTSPLNDQVSILYFEVVDESMVTFPYLYENDIWHIAKYLHGPAVVAVVETAHPQIIRSIVPVDPITVPAIQENKMNGVN